jgi:DNA-binding MarR family transcriptional regulator
MQVIYVDNLQQYAKQVDELLPLLAIKLIHFVKDLPDGDITIAQAFLLYHLHARGRCTATSIAEMMGVTSGPVTSITQRLVKRGLVHRVQDESDRRVVWFSLTSEGDIALQDLCDYSQRKWMLVLEQLGPVRAQETISLMEDTIRILNTLRSE